MPTSKHLIPLSALLVLCSLPAVSQSAARTTAQSIRGHFNAVNQHILEMAKDFPEDKYEWPGAAAVAPEKVTRLSCRTSNLL